MNTSLICWKNRMNKDLIKNFVRRRISDSTCIEKIVVDGGGGARIRDGNSVDTPPVGIFQIYRTQESYETGAHYGREK
jgi:hypothetical protein